MFNSIRHRITIIFIALTSLPLLLVGIVLAWRSYNVQSQQALELQNQIAVYISTQVSSFIKETEGTLTIVSQMEGLAEVDQEKQGSILVELLYYKDIFEELALLNAQGDEQVRRSRFNVITSETSKTLVHTDEYVFPLSNRETYYSPVRFSEVTGEPLMTIAIPLWDIHRGEVDGILVADVRFKPIWDLIARENLQLGEEESVYILDANFDVVAHRNPSIVLVGTSYIPPDRDGITWGINGTRVVLAKEKVNFGQQEFTIIAEQPTSHALELATNAISISAVVLLLALGLAGGSVFVGVRQIVGPIEAMARTARGISDGDLSQRVEVTSDDEIGGLAKAFNSMTGQLRQVITDLEQRVIDLRFTEEILRESEERFRNIFETAAVSIWEEDISAIKDMIDKLNKQGIANFQDYLEKNPDFVNQASQKIRIVDVNEATLKLFGAENKTQMLGSLDKVFVPETEEILKEEIIAIAEGSTYFEGETINRTLQGKRINILLTITFPQEVEQFESVLVSMMDITERVNAEKQLREALAEKDVLLREIHHRVKNNLQLISSLLDFQVETISDKQMRIAFRESQNRIQSIARIHEQLYQTENLARIDMEPYVRDLVDYLYQMHGQQLINFDINISGVMLEMRQALSCGLIINELVSNSLKHAFIDDDYGEITIRMTSRNRQVYLNVKDNGVGLSEDFDIQSRKTLGFRLIHMLTRQLRGELVCNNVNGTSIDIIFLIKE